MLGGKIPSQNDQFRKMIIIRVSIYKYTSTELYFYNHGDVSTQKLIIQ